MHTAKQTKLFPVLSILKLERIEGQCRPTGLQYKWLLLLYIHNLIVEGSISCAPSSPMTFVLSVRWEHPVYGFYWNLPGVPDWAASATTVYKISVYAYSSNIGTRSHLHSRTHETDAFLVPIDQCRLSHNGKRLYLSNYNDLKLCTALV